MDTLLQVAASWILPALFFWFLFSVIAMILIEVFQRITKARQKGLEEVIEKLLGKERTIKFYQHALVNPLEDVEGDYVKGDNKKEKKPSYISPSLFAKVVMEWMLTEAKKNTLNEIIQKNIHALGQENKQLGEVLQTIVTQANVKTDKDSELLDLIREDLEAWFREAVGHMSSVYGARLQKTTISVSVLAAAVANFDLVNITVRLWETSKYSELKALGLPIPADPALFTRLPVGWYCNNLPSTPAEWGIKIAGIFLGAFFIAIGSQYVFNLTKKQYKPSK